MPVESVNVSIGKRQVVIILGVAVTIVCLWLAVRGIPFVEIKTAFAKADYRTLPILLILLFAFYWIKAIRWRLLLKPQKDFHTKEVFPAMMIGFMGNNILPAHLGEFMRMIVFAKQKNLTKTAVFSTLVLERIFDVIAILLLLGIGVAFVPNLPESIQSLAIVAGAATGALLVGSTFYVVWTHQFIRFIDAVMTGIRIVPEVIREKIVELLKLGEVGLAALKDPRLTIGIAITSLVQWLVNGVMIDVALRSFGINLSLFASLTVLGVVAIGVSVPSSPGFFGLVQAAFRLALLPFVTQGLVAEADVLGASIYYHIAQYIPVTVVGLYFLNRSGFGLSQLEKQAEHQAEEMESEPIEAALASDAAPVAEPATSPSDPTE